MTHKWKKQDTYNYKTDSDPEVPSGKTMTVPDQNYSLREIMNKFTTGQPINNTGTYNSYDYAKGVEFNRNDFREFKKDFHAMDLTEQKEEVIKAQNFIKEARTPKKPKAQDNPPVPPKTTPEA